MHLERQTLKLWDRVGLLEFTCLFTSHKKIIIHRQKMQCKVLCLQKKSLNAFLVQSPCVYNHSVNVYTVDSTRGHVKGEHLFSKKLCVTKGQAEWPGRRPPWLLIQIGIDQAAGRATEVMFKLRSSN